MSHGRDLRKRRKLLGWSQPALARAAGVHKDTVRRVEAGENVTAQTLRDIEEALAAAERDLLGQGTGESSLLHQGLPHANQTAEARLLAQLKHAVETILFVASEIQRGALREPPAPPAPPAAGGRPLPRKRD